MGEEVTPMNEIEMEGGSVWFNKWLKQPKNEPEKTAFEKGFNKGFFCSSVIWSIGVIIILYFIL